jgi:hypothetical protein
MCGDVVMSYCSGREASAWFGMATLHGPFPSLSENLFTPA